MKMNLPKFEINQTKIYVSYLRGTIPHSSSYSSALNSQNYSGIRDIEKKNIQIVANRIILNKIHLSQIRKGVNHPFPFMLNQRSPKINQEDILSEENH